MPPRNRHGPMNAVKQVLQDFFDTTSGHVPPTKKEELPEGFREFEEGVYEANGDQAVALALQRYFERGGTAPAAVVAITQLAARHRATVVIVDDAISLVFDRKIFDRDHSRDSMLRQMLVLSGFLQVVGHLNHVEWCWTHV